MAIYGVQRLFSETSEEVLYSVVLNEEEYELFLEFQKEFVNKRLYKKALKTAAESSIRSEKLTKKLINELQGKPISAFNKRIAKTEAITNKLDKRARRAEAISDRIVSKNMRKNIQHPEFKKVTNSLSKTVAKEQGVKITPEMKKTAYNNQVEWGLESAARQAASGNKRRWGNTRL